MTAPRVFISYSQDSEEHKKRVLELAQKLRDDGIDCRIDQFLQNPVKGWETWMPDEIEAANYVVVICTEISYRSFRKQTEPGKRLGSTWEGTIITRELYEAQGRNEKFIPVVFCNEDVQWIPEVMRSATHYDLSRAGEYENLLRRIHDRPRVVPKPIGAAPELPPENAGDEEAVPATKWNVPAGQGGCFTGREELLREIAETLKKSGRAAIWGISGSGKTLAAAEYARRHREQYCAVLWSGAESEGAMVLGFAEIAGALDLPEREDKESDKIVTAVQRWLAGNPDWLLILDNVEDLTLVARYVPGDSPGELILTTQAQATGSVAKPIEARKMLPEEGAVLVLRRAGLVAQDAGLDDASEMDRRAAVEISELFEGLPLALDQAGAYIEETGCAVPAYLSLAQERAADLLARRGQASRHPESAAVSFALCFEKLEKKSAASADILRVGAFLHPDAIPEEIFLGGGSVLGSGFATLAGNALQLDEALGAAMQYSLIRRDGIARTVRIHRLVQILTKEGMTQDDERIWAERTVLGVNAVFPFVEFANWRDCERLLPQARACAKHVEEWGIESLESGRLLNQTGFYLSERGLYAEAEPLYRRALAIREKVLGAEHPDLARSLNNLGGLYVSQGKYAEAEPLYRRALAIRVKVLGAEHPDVATSLNNLAALYDSQGKYAEAEPLYRRALAIREKVLGAEHPAVATSLNNLAGLYVRQGKGAEAEPLYRRALAILEKALGEEHPNVASCHQNYADLLRRMGRESEAKEHEARAQRVREAHRRRNA